MTQDDAKDVGSGLRIKKIAAMEQHCESFDPGDVEEQEAVGHVMWDWSVQDDRTFGVALGVVISATKARPEELRVLMTGTFEIKGDERLPLSLKSFVEVGAPTILVPYIREAISSMTGRGPHGAFHLEPMNVRTLLAGTEAEEATGVDQLKEYPEFAKFFAED